MWRPIGFLDQHQTTQVMFPVISGVHPWLKKCVWLEIDYPFASLNVALLSKSYGFSYVDSDRVPRSTPNTSGDELCHVRHLSMPLDLGLVEDCLPVEAFKDYHIK